MLTDWDVLLLEECFSKLDGVNVGAHELLTRTRGRSAMASSHHASEMEWTIKSCWSSERVDCGRAGWTDDGRCSPFASQKKEICGFRFGFDGNPRFHVWVTGTAADLRRRLRCELARIDRLSSCGRGGPKTENADGHERFTACVSFAHCCGRIGPELHTRCSWTDLGESVTRMDFIVTSRKLEACVQVLDWFKTDHRAVLAFLSPKTKMRCTVKSDVNLRGWKQLNETAKAHKRMETKEMSATEHELKSLLLKKKREGRHLEPAELDWLCRAIWRKRSVETRETPDQGVRLRNKKIPNPRPPLNTCGPRRFFPIRETSLDKALEKLRVDYARGMGERVLSRLQMGKVHQIRLKRMFWKQCPPECLEKLARSLSVMCWDTNFPEERLCSLMVMAPNVVGATFLFQV